MRSDDPGQDSRAADGAVMRAVAAGDRLAFTRLVNAHTPALMRFVGTLLGNLAEAEELVQEAFIRLWQQAANWRPEARVSTWLHRVAYNLSVDVLRRRRPQVPVEGLAEVLTDTAPAHDERIVLDEEGRRLNHAISILPERQRTALLLCHFQELSQAEAAAVMGIGEHAYESLLARARRRLRHLLGANEKGEGWQ